MTIPPGMAQRRSLRFDDDEHDLCDARNDDDDGDDEGDSRFLLALSCRSSKRGSLASLWSGSSDAGGPGSTGGGSMAGDLKLDYRGSGSGSGSGSAGAGAGRRRGSSSTMSSSGNSSVSSGNSSLGSHSDLIPWPRRHSAASDTSCESPSSPYSPQSPSSRSSYGQLPYGQSALQIRQFAYEESSRAQAINNKLRRYSPSGSRRRNIVRLRRRGTLPKELRQKSRSPPLKPRHPPKVATTDESMFF
jgi:hypothetical protein